MSSTYSPLLRLEMIAAGEQAGLWGNTTNGNLGTLLEQAIAGCTFISLTTTSYTLSALNGASDEARAATLVFTGNPGATATVTVPLLQKCYNVKNASSQSITVKTSSQVGGVTLTAGNSLPMFCDGTDVYPAITPSALGSTALDGTGATGTWPISITGNAGTVTNGVYTTNLTTGANPANKVPKYDANGILGIGTVPVGRWLDGASGGQFYSYGIEFGGLGALSSSSATNGQAEFWSQWPRVSLFFNGYVDDLGQVRNKASGNGYGAGVSALELWDRKARIAFSENRPTSVGQAADIIKKLELDWQGNLEINGTLTQLSDRRLKNNIKTIAGAMDKVMKLRGVTYTRTDFEDKTRIHMGLVADEVEPVLPEVVDENDEGYKRVSYQNMVPLLIECIKSQEKSITKLQERCRKLEAALAVK